MKHYKHFFSQWVLKLREFPMLERSAFRDLVEQALGNDRVGTLDLTQCYRVCGAYSRNEKRAVRNVLRDHFVEADGRYACPWAEDLLYGQVEQQERLRQLRAGDGWRQFREQILERDNYRCVYCGAEDVNLQLDHVFPRSRGGVDSLENLVAACKPCNTSKGARTLEQWRGQRA